jgi:hypothetical protein
MDEAECAAEAARKLLVKRKKSRYGNRTRRRYGNRTIAAKSPVRKPYHCACRKPYHYLYLGRVPPI